MWTVAVTETANVLSACTLASRTDRAGARLSVLFIATVDSHIWYFHMPHMQLLRDMGYEVEVAAAPAGFAERIRAEGYDVHVVPFSRNPLSVRNIAAYCTLRRLMQNRRYVMVHVHTPVAGFLGRLAARRQGVPHIIYTAHGFHFHRHGSWWSNRLYYSLEKMASHWMDTLVTINREDFAVACSDFARGRAKVVYIPGVGTDCSRFAPATPSRRESCRVVLGLRQDAVVIAWVAEFIKRKRPDDAITAIQELGSENQTQLVMLGKGPLLDSIRTAAQQRGIGDTITCRGHVRNVADYLAASDVLLSTAVQEGLPKGVMEAMAAGLPVVAYDIRGCNDLVLNGETGFLVPFGDVRGLTDKLAWLAHHPNERRHMGEVGRRRIEEMFSLEMVLRQLKTVYQNELGREAL
jgi:glycosyltransferase involved in cell wall biosynthesis